MNVKIRSIFAVILLLAASLAAFTQGIDPAYAPFPAVDANIVGGQILPLAGNKLLAILYVDAYNSGIRPVVKLNANGSFDNTFNCTACGSFIPYSMALQPDGKYIIGGTTTETVAGVSRLIRINPDGSLDPTFSNPFSGITNNTNAFVDALQPDGKIYAHLYKSGSMTGNGALYRLNTDGSIDNTFTPLVYDSLEFSNFIYNVIVLPDGKIYVVGKHQTFGQLFRLNADGSKDTGFNSPILESVGPFPTQTAIRAAVVQPDGKIVFSGTFIKVNGFDRNNLARLNPDGSVDGAMHSLSFITGGGPVIIRAQSDGKIVVHKYSPDGRMLHRINADLTTDNTFSGPVDASDISDWDIDSSDRVVMITDGEFTRLNTDGSVDITFNFSLPVASKVSSIALQSDGKAVIAGDFKYLNGVLQPKFGRLNADGSTDTSFITGTGFDVKPFKLLVQADGKILALGTFNSYNGTSRPKLARLNADGSLDGSFVPTVSGAGSIAFQPDGKILLLGGAIAVNGFARTGVARLNADGTLDTAFNPLITSTPTVRAAVVHADGKIAIGGTFSAINGVGRTNFARLNADGSLDTGLTATGVAGVHAIALQANGKYVIGTNVPTAVRRLNADGSSDASFNPPAFTGSAITSLVVEANGSIVVGGQFSAPRANIVRLGPNGKTDTVFVPAGANGTVQELARQADNKIIAVGDFSAIGGVSRAGIARINYSPFHFNAPFDFDGDGRADFAVTRPSDYYWHVLTSGTLTYTATQFGTSGDKVVPADYDGDGKTDIAIWRPSTGDWWYIPSSTGIITNRNIGNNGDTPMPSDTDGNGTADMVVVTPGLIWKGIDAASGNQIVLHQFGQAGDKPLVGDFDGDGKSDLAFFRPSEGKWYYNKSSSGANLEVGVIHWGLGTDIPVPADYDGDGTTDAAVFRPSEGNWYVLNSGGGMTMLHFGATGDKPVAADYDGDGKADIAVYRPSEGFWYMLLTTGGYTGLPWGISSDIPAPNALLPLPDPPRAAAPDVPGKPAVKRR